MKAVEFESTLDVCGCISVPAEAAREIPPGEQVRVVLMWGLGPSEIDEGWRQAGRGTFDAACAPEDSVHEQLIDGASLR